MIAKNNPFVGGKECSTVVVCVDVVAGGGGKSSIHGR